MAAKAQAEQTFEAFSIAGNKAMKDGFEKAATAFGEFNAFSKDNVDAFVASASTAGKSAEKINAEVAAYAKQALESGVETAKKAATVKSVQELFELQSDYAKSALDTYVGEVNKLADMYTSSFKDAFKPLNKRVSAAVDLFQA
ncbi:MAG: phasin family protein [Maricaulaceae bacterium]|jgi:phasin family protein